MKKRNRQRFFVLLFISFVFSFIYSIPVFARDNAYVCCLYNEQTHMYQTVVIFSGSEVEQAFLGKAYFESFDTKTINNMNSQTFANGLVKNNKYYIKFNKNIKENKNRAVNLSEALTDGTKTEEKPKCALPLTFPYAGLNATEADINRAYLVSDTLGASLSDALLFLNDGHSYNEVSQGERYFFEMRYHLLSGSSTITNHYKSTYKIEWDESNGICTISLVKNKGKDIIKETKKQFVYKMEKGYVNGNGKEKTDKYFKKVLGVNSEMTNNLKYEEVMENDAEYVSWYHLVAEADILREAYQITYENYGDLYTMNKSENLLVEGLRSLLYSLETTLGCYNPDDLIFNTGIVGSAAYQYGIFPANWTNSLLAFYLISVSIALGVMVVSILLLFGKNNIASASVGARYSLMEGIKDNFLVVFFVVFALPIAFFIINLSDLFIDIFAAVSSVSGKTISTMMPTASYGVIGGIIVQFCIFIIEVYINVIYVIRRYVLTFLVAFSPLFLMCFAFGYRGKSIASKFTEEFIGMLLLQPVHAAVFSFYLNTFEGLRGIEAIILLASIIPVTNIYKRILGEGGLQLSQTAGRITARGVQMGGAAASAVGNVAGAAGSALGHTIGGVAGNGLVGKSFNLAGDIAGSIGNIAGDSVNAGMNIGAGLVLDEGAGNMNQVTSSMRSIGRESGKLVQKTLPQVVETSSLVHQGNASVDTFAKSKFAGETVNQYMDENGNKHVEKSCLAGEWNYVEDVLINDQNGVFSGEIQRSTGTDDVSKQKQQVFDDLASAHKVYKAGEKKYKPSSSGAKAVRQAYEAKLSEYGFSSFELNNDGQSAKVQISGNEFGDYQNVSVKNGNIDFS